MLAFSIATTALFVNAIAGSANADEGIASNALIHKAGLTVDWFTQSGIGLEGKIVDWQIKVNENDATTFFVIEAGNYRESITQNTLNAFGQPYGLDGAVAHIEVRKEVIAAELVNAGKKVEIKTSQFSIPSTTLYVLTSDGIVSAINGDTGNTKWTAEIGEGHLPSVGLGSSNEYVAAVNGGVVYVLQASNGKVLWSKRCSNAVGAAPAVSEERIYVPLFNGKMDVFSIEDEGLTSFSYIARGTGTARPLTTEKTVAWPTSAGDLNVAAQYGNRNKSLSYRLKADNAIVSSAIFKSGFLFTASLDGFVYAIDEDPGTVAWEISTGERISQSPVAIGDSIYTVTDEGQLYRIDARNGDMKWPAPLQNVGRYVGASTDKLYLTNSFGELIVVDQNSGAVLSRVPAGNIEYVLPNSQTDRLYICSKTGIIQCLREEASKRPHYHATEITVSQPKAVAADGKMDDGQATPAAKDANPFGSLDDKPMDQQPAAGDVDPFGAPATPAPQTDKMEETDPFATPADGGDAEKSDAAEPESSSDDDKDPFAVGG